MNFISKQIKPKALLVTAIVWVVAIILSVGICMGHTKKAVGMEVFDLKFTYGADYAQQFLDTATDEDIMYYRNIQIPVDYLLAIMLGAFPIVAMLYMKKKITVPNVFLFVALCISLLDMTENTLLLSILNGNIEIAGLAGIITMIKNLCMYTTYVMLIYFTVRYNLTRKPKKA